MSNFANRTMGVSRKGTADGATPAVGDGSPPERLGSGRLSSGCKASLRRAVRGHPKTAQLFQFAARSFRSTSLGGAKVALRASGIPCSSRSRVFVISARPNCRGFGPGPSLNVPITEHKP
jgi:hypothetical protein